MDITLFFIASCKDIIYQSLVIKHHSVLRRGSKRSTIFGVNWLSTRFQTGVLLINLRCGGNVRRLCILSDWVKVIESCLGSLKTICRERFLITKLIL